jgi:DNA polymerase-3 subunit gamma/tau
MYQSLYRKYRPIHFDDVVGQRTIVETLKNSIINSSFGHAYLFFGPRGTGKTSVSKIFARNINCLKSKNGEACGKCDACLNSFGDECVDIIEIDAASNNGVDEIRRIIENSSLVPAYLKYKVYIIDEVHMLSTGAFNALLKTLEEPPEHIVFILATTDPQKVPATISSRCQNFNFKRIDVVDIIDRLKGICKKEKIKIDEDTINEIAYISDGGLRDSLTILDQLRSFCNDDITYDKYLSLNGFVARKDLEEFIDYLFLGNISELISKFKEFNEKGINYISFINQLLKYCRDNVIDYYVNKKEIKHDVELYLDFNLFFNKYLLDIKGSENPFMYIEMLFVKFINDNNRINSENVSNSVVEEKPLEEHVIVEETVTKVIDPFSTNKLTNNIENKEVVKKEKVKTKKSIVEKRIINLDEIMKIRLNNCILSGNKKLKNDEILLLEELKNNSFSSDGPIINNILDGEVVCVSPDCVVLSYNLESIMHQNLSDLDNVSSIYNKYTNSNKNLCLISSSLWSDVSSKYIECVKNKNINDVFKYEDEPDPVYEEVENNDIMMSSANTIFDSEIVEIN